MGAKIKFPFERSALVFPDNLSVNQARMEISNAFFLRLKGLIESRVKEAGLQADWRTTESFLASINVDTDAMDLGTVRMFSQLCALRNCLAHNYGLIDKKTNEKIPELIVGRYFEITTPALENWFKFARRIFELIEAGLQNRKIN